jgi:cobalt/nickel transport system permease protein
MTLALDSLPRFDSPLARLDPRWKLAALLTAAAAAALLRTLPPALLALSGALALALGGRLPSRWLLQRLGGLALFLAVFTVWLPFLLPDPGHAWRWGPVAVSPRGVTVALLLGAKAVTIVTLMLVLLATAPLNATLQAAHALRMPGVLIHVALLTYRYIFLVAGEFARLRTALRVRGYRNRATVHTYRTVGHVAATLLVRSAERGERVGHAMRCRGFDGRFHSLAEFRTAPADLAFFVLVVGSAAVLLAWDRIQKA